MPQAEQAAGAYTLSLADSGAQPWAATLSDSAGFADVGPLPPVVASQYLLRVTEVTGPRGSASRVQTHPGSGAIYVLAGEMCVRTASGVSRIPAGASALAPRGDTPIQVSSCGRADLRALVLSVTDADRPFASPAQFPAPPSRPAAPESPGYEPPNRH